MIGPELVYILCSVTGAFCALLLLRAYARTEVRLLLWSGVCFIALAAENVLLFVDTRMPDNSLASIRNGVALAGLLCLLYGLIWEARSK
jgi:hypothetical protein